LKDIKFKYKILAFPIIFIVIFLISFFISEFYNKKNTSLLNKTEHVYLPNIEISIKLNNELSNVQRLFQDAVASADESKLDDADTLAKKFNNLCFLLVEKTGKTSATDSISTAFRNYFDNAKSVSKGMIANDISEQLSNDIASMQTQYSLIDSLLKKLEHDSKVLAELHFRDIEKNNSKAENINILVLTLGVVIFLLISYLMSLAIINPLRKIVGYMERISQKQIDFVIQEQRKDEVGELNNSINEICSNFRSIIKEIKETAASVLRAGNQLSSISHELAQRANEQAATTEEISSSMEEMLATISSNTEKAVNTGEISSNSAKEIEESNKVFQETINAVSEISKKTSIISDLSFQTNLLSLNASIEAARAGAAGKGFAVVAQEVRNLAEKSRIASEDIENLSKSGNEISMLAGEKLEKVIPNIILSAELVKNIVTASLEQESGVVLISNSIQQLTEITNQNSASAEKMSASAQELNRKAQNLSAVISVFQIGNEN
jgi:methyl-accepting chemotaxis protein